MKTDKRKLAEGFATIIMAMVVSGLLFLILLSGVGSFIGEVPGLSTLFAGAIIFAMIVGVIIHSVIFAIIHVLRPALSALVAVLIASVIIWIFTSRGSFDLMALALQVGFVLVGNFAAKRIKLDKKIYGIMK